MSDYLKYHQQDIIAVSKAEESIGACCTIYFLLVLKHLWYRSRWYKKAKNFLIWLRELKVSKATQLMSLCFKAVKVALASKWGFVTHGYPKHPSLRSFNEWGRTPYEIMWSLFTDTVRNDQNVVVIEL